MGGRNGGPKFEPETFRPVRNIMLHRLNLGPSNCKHHALPTGHKATSISRNLYNVMIIKHVLMVSLMMVKYKII